MRFLFCLLLINFVLFACSKDRDLLEENLIEIPAGFNIPFIPADNAITEARFKLGKILFYDKSFSRNFSLSCASCHKPELAFTDGLQVSKGIDNLFTSRNAPTLTNVAYNPYYLTEGGVPTLEQQVLVPIQEHPEFDNNILLIADALNKRPEIVALSLEAYNRLPDPFVITRSISVFERTIISGNSSYDQYKNQGKENALTNKQLLGLELFNSDRTNCSKCHSGNTFTNYSFQNNGLYNVYIDSGRKRLTGKSEDEALFKVPTLRNIELTGPYMHDGSIESLEEVIEHYNKGAKMHFNKSPLIKPLNLSKYEQEALLDFLKSLTDFSFIKNKKYRL